MNTCSHAPASGIPTGQNPECDLVQGLTKENAQLRALLGFSTPSPQQVSAIEGVVLQGDGLSPASAKVLLGELGRARVRVQELERELAQEQERVYRLAQQVADLSSS